MQRLPPDEPGHVVVEGSQPVRILRGIDSAHPRVDADTLDVKDNGALIAFQGRVRVYIPNAPAGTIAGPEREGSTPQLELLQSGRSTSAGETSSTGKQPNGSGE